MGKKSTEIQSDLERQRHAVEARIDRLRRRLRDDMEKAKNEARSDVDRTVGKESTVAQHPKALVAASAGTGVVLGILSESVSVPRPKLHRDGKQAESRETPSEERRGLTGALTAAALGAAQGQLNELLQEAWGGFKSGFKSKDKVNDNSRLPADVRGGQGGSSDVPETSLPGVPTRTPGAASNPGGHAATLERGEMPHNAVDADMALREGEKSPAEIMHDARVEQYVPHEAGPPSAGMQGEGLLMPRTPGAQAPFEEGDQRSERRTGQ